MKLKFSLDFSSLYMHAGVFYILWGIFMAGLNQTPSGERIHISIFGRRNSGKSSIINALTNQNISIVSSVAGTTTDPVTKTMEILPLGPVVVTDTAGIDDIGELGEMRVQKTLRVMENTDIALLVIESGVKPSKWEEDILSSARVRELPIIVVANKTDLENDYTEIKNWAEKNKLVFVGVSAQNGSGVNDLREILGNIKSSDYEKVTIVGDILKSGDIVVCVIPIDSSAPKGRLILPQVMTIRDIIDSGAIAMAVRPDELADTLLSLAKKPKIVITDSQVFGVVSEIVPKNIMLTGFSFLMARVRGDLKGFVKGIEALKSLKNNAHVLISEGCTHHRQCEDIGTVKIPKLLKKFVGDDVVCSFTSGKEFPTNLKEYDLVIHCGGCMLNRREILYRQRIASSLGVPMTNYGMFLAYANGILDRALEPFENVIK